ncbi:MAG: hypothetical protein OXQ29_04065 [Rhodospirillaceae bacterium]|nr:hypothetical protein [Rhodospirillaceae bacterium]
MHRELREEMSQTWLLSGIPRSGTSLCCRLAGELPDTVALSEPMRHEVLAGVDSPDQACLRIEEFTRQARVRILGEGRALSIQRDGRLDDNMVAGEFSRGGLRTRNASLGEIEVGKALRPEFTLLVKHNALFAALLPQLIVSFACLALVRNPLAVLASWQTVSLPVHDGRIPAGEQFDSALRGRLAAEPDALRRQIAVLNWFFSGYLSHLERDNIIRYEDLVDSGGSVLFRLLGHADAVPIPLENRNTNLLYKGSMADVLLRALMEEGGAWSEFYEPAECERAADLIRVR